MSSNKVFNRNCFTYIKITTNSSDKYYQNKKGKTTKKKLVKDSKLFLQKKKKKSEDVLTIQKSIRRWKTKTSSLWLRKNIKWKRKALLLLQETIFILVFYT